MRVSKKVAKKSFVGDSRTFVGKYAHKALQKPAQTHHKLQGRERDCMLHNWLMEKDDG